MADAAPRIEDLPHLRRIIRDELERAGREGLGCLFLEGCVRTADRALVDEQVRAVLAAEPGCRLISAHATPAGYLLNLGRVGVEPTRTAGTETDRSSLPP
jgi:hypothetical protein